MRSEARVAIIGGGYAGMSAAVELTDRGVPVTVFETSRVLGGRARAVAMQGITLDNGQHILIGAYRETLRLMGKVGADPAQLLLRLPLTMEYPGELRVAAPNLPAPLHLAWALLGAHGLSWRDKFAAIRFMQSLKAARFQLPHGSNDITVSALLDIHRQPPRLREYLWDALCVAALNTPAEMASARIFLNVLRDSLAADRQASDLLLPRVDLGALFPDPAARYVTAHGGRILHGLAISRLVQESDRWGLHEESSAHGLFSNFSHVICAIAPYHLPTLLGGLPGMDGLQKMLAGFRYQPIVTCYLAYPAQVKLPEAMLGQANGIMQWLFDRKQITNQLGGPPGLLAAVISARGQHLALSHEELATRIHAEIAGIVPNLPKPLWSQVITEKRATYSCTPDLPRPATTTALPGLLLAGDYIAGDYPGTIEAAVRSGVAAAEQVR